MTAPRAGGGEVSRPADFIPFGRSEIEQSLVSAFEAQVLVDPSRIAVKTATETLSYGALNAWANRVAHGLLASRSRRPEPVALFFEQGAASVVAILAVLKAGKFYVSLDPAADPTDHRTALAQSGCALLLHNHGKPAAREALAGMSVTVSTLEQLGAGRSEDNPGLALSPKSLAYIFFTSGSTGRPKGVVDNHRNVLHNVMRYTNRLGISPSDRLSMLQAPSFSGTVSSLFAALLNGATLYPFDLQSRGISSLADLLVNEAITIYHSVPAIFRSLLATSRDFPAVRVVRLEGDRASAVDLALFNRHFGPRCVLANGLGLTETGLVRQLVLHHGATASDGGLPVGHPVEDIVVSVLDDEHRPVAPGSSGEIAVSSRYLALGYWRDPARTRAKFLRSDTKGGGRTYLTGDLGRLRKDGCLEHLGRLDARTKIRGQWADLADVEAGLLTLGVFSHVIVRPWDEGGKSQRLVAYYVAADQARPSPGEIRAELSQALPSHMIPARYVRLEALPLTANGKLDYAALPAPDRGRPDLAVPYRPPSDHLQDQLVDIWERLLGVAPVGTDDSFLDLGGDSLLAMMLLLNLEEAFDRQFRQSLLIEAQSVAQLADVLAGDLDEGTPAAAVALRDGTPTARRGRPSRRSGDDSNPGAGPTPLGLVSTGGAPGRVCRPAARQARRLAAPAPVVPCGLRSAIRVGPTAVLYGQVGEAAPGHGSPPSGPVPAVGRRAAGQRTAGRWVAGRDRRKPGHSHVVDRRYLHAGLRRLCAGFLRRPGDSLLAPGGSAGAAAGQG